MNRKVSKCRALAAIPGLVLLVAFAGPAQAITCNSGTTGAGDTCTVNANQTVADAVTNVSGSLLVTNNATLTFSNGAGATVNVDEDLTVDAGSTMSARGANNAVGRDLTFAVGGDVVIDGTVDTRGGNATGSNPGQPGGDQSWTVGGTFQLNAGGALDLRGTSGQPGGNSGALTLVVNGATTEIDGTVDTRGATGSGGNNDGGNGGNQDYDVVGNFTLLDDGLLDVRPGNGSGTGSRGTPGAVTLAIGGNGTIEGMIDTDGGDVTAAVVGNFEVATLGVVDASGQGHLGGAVAATVNGAIMVGGVIDTIGSNGQAGGDVTLLACSTIDVVGIDGDNEAEINATGGGGNPGGNGANILLHAGDDITVGPHAAFDALHGGASGTDGTIALTTAGVVIDNGATFDPTPTITESAGIPEHCTVAAAGSAKISGGINYGFNPPGNDPEWTFATPDEIVDEAGDEIVINYRAYGPSLCTFTATAINFPDATTAVIDASYACAGGDKDGDTGTATITLVDRSAAPPRGAVKVDASDDDLDIDDGGDPVLLETGNVIIEVAAP